MSRDPMRSYSVTVTMTPRQAIEAEYALRKAAIGYKSGRLFSACQRINVGLYDAGWWSTPDGAWFYDDDEPASQPTPEPER